MHNCTSHEIFDLQVMLFSASDLVAACREIWSYIDIEASAGKVEVDSTVFRRSAAVEQHTPLRGQRQRSV